jgi:hypothetical protein
MSRWEKVNLLVERASERDRRFFERNPDRQHRVRPAHPAEFEQVGLPEPPDDSPFKAYIAVKQIEPGVRIRKPLYAIIPHAVGEDEARSVFEGAFGQFEGAPRPTKH